MTTTERKNEQWNRLEAAEAKLRSMTNEAMAADWATAKWNPEFGENVRNAQAALVTKLRNEIG